MAKIMYLFKVNNKDSKKTPMKALAVLLELILNRELLTALDIFRYCRGIFSYTLNG